jgi:hypothetical protein
MEPILIDVEEPNQPTVTLSLEKATETYMLDEADINTLKTGGIVWYKSTALTMQRND